MRHGYFDQPPSKMVATAELVLAGAFWGLGYVASKWALTSMGPFAIVFLRFAVAFGLGWAFLKVLSPGSLSSLRADLVMSSRAGLALGVTLVFQTLGLQYTTVTRCGFLTGLYVVFVPILESLILRSAIRLELWIWIAVATIGTLLMCGMDAQGWNVGDTFSLCCAVTAAYQIVAVGKLADKIHQPFSFNIAQNFWAFIPALAFLIGGEDLPALPWTGKAWVGMLILSVGCTLVGFWLQVRAQRVLIATVVSILFLLESPFAALFGFVFFDERLAWDQLIGAVLILLACWKTVTLDGKSNKST
jgi:drug/metabolite transporter (DMT)-like permease